MAKLSLKNWLVLIAGTAIQGGAVSVVAVLGLATSHLIDASIKPLELNQIWGVFLGGAIARIVLYLQKQPVPMWKGDTESLSKPKEEPK